MKETNSWAEASAAISEEIERLGLNDCPAREDFPDNIRIARDDHESGKVNHFQDIVLGWQRYEKVRKLNPHQFTEIWKKNLATGVHFDKLIDEL